MLKLTPVIVPTLLWSWSLPHELWYVACSDPEMSVFLSAGISTQQWERSKTDNPDPDKLAPPFPTGRINVPALMNGISPHYHVVHLQTLSVMDGFTTLVGFYLIPITSDCQLYQPGSLWPAMQLIWLPWELSNMTPGVVLQHLGL